MTKPPVPALLVAVGTWAAPLSATPDGLPVGVVRVGGARLLDLGQAGVVHRQQIDPDQPRQQRRQPPTVARAKDQRDERGDNDIAVATVEDAVVVELGGRENRPRRVYTRLPLHPRHDDRDDDRGHEHNDMPRGAVIPAGLRRQRTGTPEQQRSRHAQEQISRDERHKLLVGRHGQDTALANHADDEHHARRDGQAEGHGLKKTMARQPPKPGQQSDLVRVTHADHLQI